MNKSTAIRQSKYRIWRDAWDGQWRLVPRWRKYAIVFPTHHDCVIHMRYLEGKEV
jgi:hypothetical protein